MLLNEPPLVMFVAAIVPLLPPLPPLLVIVHVLVPFVNNANVLFTEELPLTVNVPNDEIVLTVNVWLPLAPPVNVNDWAPPDNVLFRLISPLLEVSTVVAPNVTAPL